MVASQVLTEGTGEGDSRVGCLCLSSPVPSLGDALWMETFSRNSVLLGMFSFGTSSCVEFCELDLSMASGAVCWDCSIGDPEVLRLIGFCSADPSTGACCDTSLCLSEEGGATGTLGTSGTL